MRQGWRWLGVLMAVVGFLIAWLAPAAQNPQEAESCRLCHRDLTLEPLQSSVHKSLSCTICHVGAKQIPHEQPTDPQICATCHPKTQAYWESVHGRGLLQGIPDVPNCAACHGGHDIRPTSDPNSRVFPFNLPQTCGGCHGNEKLAVAHQIPVPEAYQQYLESVHGQGLLRSGLLVAATCADCHGAHDTLPNSDPRSRLYPSRIPETCGRCHLGVLNEYQASVHGKLPLEQGPVCTNCHQTHAIQPPREKAFQLASVLACADCHPEAFDTYRESYHGQVTTLGYAGVATCADCHGNHQILPPEDPESTLSAANIVSTCQACHSYANANFVAFLPHVRPSDSQTAPPALYGIWLFMTALLFGVFSVFGTHTLLWAVRGYVVPAVAPLLKLLPRRGKRKAAPKTSTEEENHEAQ